MDPVSVAVVVVVCCAGVGFTLSILTSGSSRKRQHTRGTDEDDKEEENEREDSDDDDRGGGGGAEDSSSSSRLLCTNSSSNSRSRGGRRRRKRRVMVVIAHPDDEVLFFGPTILHFTKQEEALVYLLCMSTGNYYGEGRIRGRELLASCALLGVDSNHVYLYRCDDLPDHPHVAWPTPRTAALINHHLHALDVDMVVTFDEGGVSGHVNHSALYLAMRHLAHTHSLPPGCEAFSLDTVGVLRKYSSLLDAALTYTLSHTLSSISCAYTIHPTQHAILQRAMRAHSSQYVWFRRLYMYFSRYVLINTFTPITP